MVTNNPESNGQPFGGNVGRKVKKDVRDLRQKQFDLKAAVVNAISPERMFAIAEQIITLAEAGNIEAATWIWDRCIGKPINEPTEIGDERQTEAAKVVLLDWRRNGSDAAAESN